MTEHCADNGRDRDIGAKWERNFCKLAAKHGLMFTPMQIGRTSSAVAYTSPHYRTLTLPDITIWSYPGQHHEIKHKAPTPKGWFGLEVYRFNALMEFARETRQNVLYTIHNHQLAGGRDVDTNDIQHWLTANVLELEEEQLFTQQNGTSWVSGKKQTGIPIHYWAIEKWIPLLDYWAFVAQCCEPTAECVSEF